VSSRKLNRWLDSGARSAGAWVTKAGHVARAVPAALKARGGAGGALKNVLSLYRRGGMDAVKQRLQMALRFNRNDYGLWVRRYDTIDEFRRERLEALCAGLLDRPTISIVMTTHNPKQKWLTEAIASVRRQVYPNWELCIADDASPDAAIRAILERYALEDERIKVVFREKNGHICAAANSALCLATGEWVALLDHDDLLPEHALLMVAEAIGRSPDVGLLYSDEDRIDEAGQRSSPCFKCDWNLELFRAHDMITRLGVFRRELITRLDGFRIGYEGSRDYDLALRVVELLKPEQIVHMPYVLYHRRVNSDSAASRATVKSHAQDAGVKALQDHLSRQGIDASAELTRSSFRRVRYRIPFPPPRVSLIIPTRNGFHLIRQCIESILSKTTYANYEILIIDNGSDDPETLGYLLSLNANPKIRVLRDDRPFNYSALNNMAVQHADGEYIGLLNNDIEVISPDWLDEMVGFAVQPDSGAIGACLWYPNDTLQHGGVVLGIQGVAGHAHKRIPRGSHGYFGRAVLPQWCSAVTAACLLIKKSIYLEVGGLNENDLKVAFNDVDFCLKVREAGYRNIWTPFAELYHHESATRGLEDTPEKHGRFAKEIEYMKRTWGDALVNDPAYSPNLTLHHEDFSLAWPPRVPAL
jgi:glycosyltransferase involved in cell wall biosynthesis